MSSSLRSRIAPWLELARVSNVPTVVSNAFCGLALGASLTQQPIPVLSACAIAMGSAALYVAGMVLNDVLDAPIDAVERPSRPIPSGRVRRSDAIVLFWLLLATGLALPAFAGGASRWVVMLAISATIAVCVAAYNALHARLDASVVLLGVCRGLVVILGASCVLLPQATQSAVGISGLLPSTVTIHAIVLVAYVSVFSWIARREVGASGGGAWRTRVAWTLPVAAIISIVVSIALNAPNAPLHTSTIAGTGISRVLLTIGMGVLFAAWLARSAWLWSSRDQSGKRRVPLKVHAVMGWIAGLSMLDACVVTALDGPWWWMLVPLACFVLTITLQRRVLGS